MLNRIILIGHLTRDPELKYTTQGVPLATFGIAVNRPTKNPQGEREVDFFNVVAWRQRAEFISQYGAKGRLTAVEGRVQIRNFVGQDGVKRTAVDVVADNVELLGPGGNAPAGAAHTDTPGAPAPPASEPEEFADPFSEA
jgi:single-strand DNA-binding protein